MSSEILCIRDMATTSLQELTVKYKHGDTEITEDSYQEKFFSRKNISVSSVSPCLTSSVPLIGSVLRHKSTSTGLRPRPGGTRARSPHVFPTACAACVAGSA